MMKRIGRGRAGAMWLFFGLFVAPGCNGAHISVDVCQPSDDPDATGCQHLAVATLSGLQTSEDGGQIRVEVVLSRAPSADVRLPLSVSDSTEGSLSATSLTFTSTNWNAPQSVTLTGVDDDLLDGPQQYQVVFAAVVSSDATFSGYVLPALTVTNIDNDTAGITVSAASGNTGENGNQASFTVVLNAEPSASVTVNFASDDASEGVTGVTSLTFTTANWNAPQTVTVTGQDDDLADGPQAYSVVFTATTGDDTDYAGLVPDPVDLVNVDDDTAGITVSAASGNTGENGNQASFTVVLNAEPSADVTLTFASSDASEGTVGSGTVTFTAVNWAAPQTVVVTGQDDDLVDGDQLYQIEFGAIASDDSDYAAIVLAPVALRNVDNDTAGITVSAATGNTGENGSQASFTVVLNAEPRADVTLTFDSDDSGEGSLDLTTLIFTAANWNAPQIVTATGVDDDVADGDQSYAVVFAAASSGDTDYDGLTPANVVLTNLDDDSAAIRVSAVSGRTHEGGAQATFTVVLNSQPFDDVTVSFASNDAGEGTTDVTSLTFSAVNWAAPRTVTITGQDDDFADGNQPYAIVFGATTSTDAAYAAITPSNVAVVNDDNDSAGITVSAISGNTTEGGGTATFTVVLNSEPFGTVNVSFASNDPGEGTTTVASRSFNAGNWSTPQTVTVTGVDDDLADGNQPYAIVFGATTGGDAAYNMITPMNVVVTNMDNDSVGITVSAISGNTTEGGGTATFTVVLNSEPFSPVTVNFATNDPSEGTTAVTSLTFTSATWSMAQSVTVTGVDDAIADGSVSYAIAFSGTTSADVAYAAITPGNVAVINDDNDVQACATGNDEQTSAPWIVCSATPTEAWISANNSGSYHATHICQSLGYNGVGQYGGTCGVVCGYCAPSGGCNAPGARTFDGGGASGTPDDLILQYTVHWTCVM